MDSATRNIVIAAAEARKLPPELVLAMVAVESSGEPWATRTEPAYRWLWNVSDNKPYRVSHKAAASKTPPGGFPAPPGISQLTEWIAQQTSWGLLQVMGANARAAGMTGPLTQLCDPETGAAYGCRHLARLAAQYRYTHGWRGVCQAYNTGSPESINGYPGKVASQARAMGVPDVFGEQ